MSYLKFDGTAAALSGASKKDLFGTSKADNLVGTSANETLWGQQSGDTLSGGAGDDTYYLTSGGVSIVEKAGEGVDTVVSWTNTDLSIYANVENLIVQSDSLVKAYGNALNNVIMGGKGSQEIYGGLGQDVLIGGAGADTFIVKKGEGNDVIQDFNRAEGDKIKLVAANLDTFAKVQAAMSQVGADVKIDMGDGDALLLRNTTIASFTASDFTLNGAAPPPVATDTPTTTAPAAAANPTASPYLKFDGTAAALSGASKKDLFGTSKADNLVGTSANETLWGQQSGDTLSGGAGDDTYYLTSGGVSIVEKAGEGVDTVVSWTNTDLSIYANVENLIVQSDSLVKAYGNALNNVIMGGKGSQEIYGGLGQDVLIGGAGADTFIVKKGEGNDVIQDFNRAEGDKIKLVAANLDTFAKVQAAMSQVGADVKIDMGDGDALLLRNTTIASFTASDFGITAAAAPVISPPAAIEAPVVKAPVVDTRPIVAGQDADYSVSPVFNSAAKASAAQQKYFFGTSAKETITGTSGHDALFGGQGDTLMGGAGDDTYYYSVLGDKAVESANGGVDTIVAYHSLDLSKTPYVENLSVSGNGLYAAGNDLDNMISGGSGKEEIYGGMGQDILTGGAGKDTFIVYKGEGNDVIRDFNASEDTIRLKAGFSSFAQVKTNMTQVGADVVINMGDGDGLLIKNTSLSSLTANNFQLQIDYSKLGAMTFADDFNAPLSLYDRTYNKTGTWTPDFGYGGVDKYSLTSNGEKQIYTSPYFRGHAGDFSESPFVNNADGTMSIWAKPSTNSEIFGYGYTSGLLTTKDTFSQLYGYFEMRADLPEATGTWPAFWMLPSNGSWPPELDIMEVLGNDSALVNTSQHTKETGQHLGATDTNYTPATSDGMHTYGVLWTPTNLVFYVDSVEVYDTRTPADMNTKMYMLVNMALGGWAGAIDNSTIPAEMKIDYVHAYALPSDWNTLF